MRKVSSLSAAVILAAAGAFNTWAQQSTGFIVGKISERTTGQPVEDAKITARPNAAVMTDADGIFRLEVESGVYDLRIDADGFSSVVRNQVAVTGGRNAVVNVQLDIMIAETVDVRSDIFTENLEQQVSSATLSREVIRSTPGTGGDPLRAINSLPGVSAASGEFADLIVRGGTADENLTLVDNIPVSDFTYFTDKYDGSRGGRAGILAPDIFERAEFSAGGFGVRYGDRMSSALDIAVREANHERLQGVLFADSGNAGGSLDVPLGKRGSWLVSGRRSFIDVALDVAGIADQGVIGYPRTLDFINKFVYDVTPRHKISFTALNLFETFQQTDEQAGNIARRTDRLRMRRTSERHILGTTLSSTLGSKTLAQTSVWGSIAHNDGTFYLPFTTLLQRSRDLRDSQFGVKEELTSALSPAIEIAVGGGVYFEQANYHSFERGGAFFSPLEEEFNSARREHRLVLDQTASAYGYAQATWRATRAFSITPGVRVDRYGVSGETLFSPRLAARYAVRPGAALTFAAGVYRQPPAFFPLSLTPGNRSLKAQRSTHIIGGIEWLAREDIRVRVEGYRKTYGRLIVEPIFPTETFAISGNYFNSGGGHSTGTEVSVQKALTGYFSGQASYAFIRSRRSYFSGTPEFRSDFERPHQLTLIGISRFYGFSVAAKYRVASGLPYTRRTAVEAFPGSGAFLQRIGRQEDINALRLPGFASLDLRAEKRFGFRRWSVAPYIDVFNITNHDSVVQPNYEFFDPNTQFLRENRRLPIFGFRLEF